METDTAYYYLQGAWAATDDLSLELGITKHDLEYTYRSPIEFSGRNSIDAETDDVDIKFGGVYRFTEDWEVFVGYSENSGASSKTSFSARRRRSTPTRSSPRPLKTLTSVSAT